MSLSAKDNLKKGSTQLSHICDLNIKKQSTQRRLVSIVATISRASRNIETIYNMLMKGVNIFRLNFSHESHESHTQTIEIVKKSLQRIKNEFGQTVSVAFAVDTRGPQIRTGLLEGGNEILLRSGENIRLSINRDLYDKGSKEAIYVDYPNIINVAKPEDRVFVDDGKLFLTILEVGVDGLVCEVVQGGLLGHNCNVILPEVEIDLPAVSEKDMDDLQFSVRSNIDIVFASGVRSAKNIRELRSVLGDKGKHIKIIAKVDSKIALSRVPEIMNASDGLLLSRADLGTQIPIEKLFITQKSVLGQCNKAGKPVIIASNVLESMRFNPVPTRAECFDLANAVIDGVDCIMLSSEISEMENEVIAISSDEEWEEALPQGPPREDQPRTSQVHSFHHSTINISVALEDMMMVLRGEFTTMYIPAPGVQRTSPHVEEPTSLPGSPTPSQPESRDIPTDEELERWASPTPWTARDGEDEDAEEEVPDQLPPREVGGGMEHCPSSRAEAGEPEELWTRRSNRHEGPKPTPQRPLEDDA
ncbi:uncharacterized protein Dmoj_GI26832, partial [Drosophila mojavensis]